MKRFIVAAILAMCAGTTFAGLAAPPMEVDPNENSDLTGALVLLALMGVVIASGAFSGRGSAESSNMEPGDASDS